VETPASENINTLLSSYILVFNWKIDRCNEAATSCFIIVLTFDDYFWIPARVERLGIVSNRMGHFAVSRRRIWGGGDDLFSKNGTVTPKARRLVTLCTTFTCHIRTVFFMNRPCVVRFIHVVNDIVPWQRNVVGPIRIRFGSRDFGRSRETTSDLFIKNITMPFAFVSRRRVRLTISNRTIVHFLALVLF